MWGFITGGLVWFSIPFTLATTMGLAYLGLSSAQGAPMLSDEDVMKVSEALWLVNTQSKSLWLVNITSTNNSGPCGPPRGPEAARHHRGVRHPVPDSDGSHVHWISWGHCSGLHRHLRCLSSEDNWHFASLISKSKKNIFQINLINFFYFCSRRMCAPSDLV